MANSKFLFGVGRGKLNRKAAKKLRAIAMDNDATFVEYCGPECYCGRNCGGCNYQYWFSAANLGGGIDDARAARVAAAIEAAFPGGLDAERV